MKDKLLMAHHQLNNEFVKRNWIFTLIGFFVVSRYFLNNQVPYNQILWSIDVPMAIFSLMYITILKPLLFTGILSGYYQMGYDPKFIDYINFYGFIGSGAIGRLLPYLLNGNSLFPNEALFALTATVIIISTLLFFKIFYQNKFVSIKRYSEGTRLIMYSNSEKYAYERLNPYKSGATFMSHYKSYRDVESLQEQRRKMSAVSDDPILHSMFGPEIQEIKRETKIEDIDNKSDEILRRKSRVTADREQ